MSGDAAAVLVHASECMANNKKADSQISLLWQGTVAENRPKWKKND